MKLTEEMKVRLDEATAEAFRRRAHQAGCSTGELLRDVVVHLEWGVTWGEHVANHRRAALSREGPVRSRLHVFNGPGNGPVDNPQVSERA